jgi:hypothetical protein
MAYVPGYTGDVFISYAHLDNGDGWVTDVKDTIAERLRRDLAGEPEIWFDADRLRTGDIFKQEIHDKLNRTLILIAVVSPSFLKSEFCRLQELDYFLDQLGREVIQIQKVRLEEGTTAPLPDTIYAALFDATSEAPLRGEGLNAKLNAIIKAIREKMEAAKKACDKIYLAQPANGDLRSAFKTFGRALHESRLAVLPDEIVSIRTLESKIQKWVEDASLSIHLRTNPADPLSAIQLRIAEQAGTPLLVLDSPPRTPNQLADAVEKVRDQLSQNRRKRELYFVCDRSVQEHAARLTPQIETYSGLKVILPQPGETYHQAKLQSSDGIVLFRNAAPEPWFLAHREKLQQVAALRRGKLVQEAYYLARAGLPEQVACNQTSNRWLINRVGPPQVADLCAFLDALQPSAASSAATAGDPSK